MQSRQRGQSRRQRSPVKDVKNAYRTLSKSLEDTVDSFFSGVNKLKDSAGQNYDGALGKLGNIDDLVRKIDDEQGPQSGNELLKKYIEKRVDVAKLHSMLTPDQKKLVKRLTSLQTSDNEMVGGAEFTLMEILLTFLLFPWSLIYVIYKLAR